jgi:hypothetical protein
MGWEYRLVGAVEGILAGTGHINVGQGAIMAAHGIGAALSPLLGDTSPKNSVSQRRSRCSARCPWDR